MKGWFDAFRNDGGPTLYNFSNRTAVTGDVTVITLLVIFATLYVAFLIIFPGIRKEVSFCYFRYKAWQQTTLTPTILIRSEKFCPTLINYMINRICETRPV